MPNKSAPISCLELPDHASNVVAQKYVNNNMSRFTSPVMRAQSPKYTVQPVTVPNRNFPVMHMKPELRVSIQSTPNHPGVPVQMQKSPQNAQKTRTNHVYINQPRTPQVRKASRSEHRSIEKSPKTGGKFK